MGVILKVTGELYTNTALSNLLRDKIIGIQDGWGDEAFLLRDTGDSTVVESTVVEYAADEMEGHDPLDSGILKPLKELLHLAQQEQFTVSGTVRVQSDWTSYDNVLILVTENQIDIVNSEIYDAEANELIKELKRRGFCVTADPANTKNSGTLYEESIIISDTEAAMIRKYTTVEPSCKGECQGEDATIIHSVRFANGVSMDIKCCGVQFAADNPDNRSWTEAVLFDANGCEIAVSEVSDDYFGEWELSDGNNTYFVSVMTESEHRRDLFESACYHAYQLDWMISHGHSIQDYMDGVIGVLSQEIDDNFRNISGNARDISAFVLDAQETFELDAGFGSGSIFVCKQEFLNAEFRDPDYMRHLFEIMHMPEEERQFWAKIIE